METTPNQRVIQLKTDLRLGTNEFARKAGISTGTVWSIQNGTVMQPRTIKCICDAFNVNKEWILTGKGKMFNDAPKDPAPSLEITIQRIYDEFKNQLKVKDEQIAALTSILQKVNFLEPLNGAGLHKKALRVAA